MALPENLPSLPQSTTPLKAQTRRSRLSLPVGQRYADLVLSILGEEVGPVDNDELVAAVVDGRIATDTKVRRSDKSEWKTADKIKGLSASNNYLFPTNRSAGLRNR
jgi:predicted RNA-binding protein associated with RNAse of E/G family